MGVTCRLAVLAKYLDNSEKKNYHKKQKNNYPEKQEKLQKKKKTGKKIARKTDQKINYSEKPDSFFLFK